MQALVGEVPRHVHKPPPSVGQAVGHDRLEFFGVRQIARQGITHLDGPVQLGRSLLQHRGQVLPGMAVPGEEQGDPMPVEDRHDARGEHARALGAAPQPVGSPGGPLRARTFMRRIVIVEDLALGRLADHLVEDRLDLVGTVLDDLPLRRGRQEECPDSPPAVRGD